ncbi:class I tRNA ligase family protein [Candidatus Vidania fulgoroideorum]
MKFNHSKIAKKYIKEITSIKYKTGKKKTISMIPYPSGELHLGHIRNYTINDIICRRKKKCMYMGWDSFGLPAENESFKKKIPVKKCVFQKIKQMRKQMFFIGLNINWDYEINTCRKFFYNWTQYIFKLMYKSGYIFRKRGFINWDPVDETSLSDEQSSNGSGWRSGTTLHKKIKEVFFLKIKNILDLSLREIKYSNWPFYIKKSQSNWIGRSLGRIFFIGKDKIFLRNRKFNFLAISIYNPLVKNLVKIRDFFSSSSKVKNLFFNFINIGSSLIPLAITNKFTYDKYYHTLKFNLNEINIYKLKKKIKINYFSINNVDLRFKKIYKILNWNISRQRKWGTPIPLIKCKFCGYQLIKKNLSVLDKKKKKCSICKLPSVVESDTLDTFFDSSYYYLHFFFKNFKILNFLNCRSIYEYIGGKEHTILHLMYARFFTIILNKLGLINFSSPFKKLIIHGVILNKSYFYLKNNVVIWTKKSKNSIYNGLIKMSKSKNNGVNSNKYIKKYGADTLRMYLMFISSIENNIIWDDSKIKGCYRFIKKIWYFGLKLKLNKLENSDFIKKKIASLEENIYIFYSNKKYNKVISFLMQELTLLNKCSGSFLLKKFRNFLINIYPICPIFSCALWDLIYKGKIYFQCIKKFFSEFKKKLIIQINGVNKNYIFNKKKNIKNIIYSLKKVHLFFLNLKRIIFNKEKFINFII